MLKLENVSKYIENKKIIDNISFEVSPGKIFGFLGPNGAGKSTTMKMICGLIKADKGTILINNINISKYRIKAISNLAALIEIPKLYEYLSAKENLMQLARLDDISELEVDKTLKLVGLSEKQNNKVKTYSLGMKQRLGIAQVLMGNKKLLILDEPTNGLDANGIVEFRNTIKKIVKEKNVTIFISSHKLDEIEKLCDTIAFIDSGKIKSIESINVNQNSINKLYIYTKCIDECSKVLKASKKISKLASFNEGIVVEYDSNCFKEILNVLIKNNINFSDIKRKEKTLEDRYLDLIGDDSND